MKKLSLVLLLFIAAATTVNAQNQKGVVGLGSGSTRPTAQASPEVQAREATAKKQTDDLDKIVGLTDDQKKDIYNMNLTLAHRTDIIKNSESAEKAKLLKEIEDFRVKTAMQKLTGDQVAKYNAAKSK